jgi:hypothetical protein
MCSCFITVLLEPVEGITISMHRVTLNNAIFAVLQNILYCLHANNLVKNYRFL